MTWTKLCDTLHSHPKALTAGDEALGFWTRALSLCGAYLTDGHVSRVMAMSLAGNRKTLERVAQKLVAAGLWELDPLGDGWWVHDFLDHNRSRDQVRADKEAKRAGGEKGAAKRWTKVAVPNVADPVGQPIAAPTTGPIRNGDAPVPSRPDPSRPAT